MDGWMDGWMDGCSGFHADTDSAGAHLQAISQRRLMYTQAFFASHPFSKDFLTFL